MIIIIILHVAAYLHYSNLKYYTLHNKIIIEHNRVHD